VKRLLLVAPLAALAAGCGGGTKGSASGDTSPQGPIGSGARQVWFYPAHGKAKSVVIFLHGYSGNSREETPVNHVAWLKHLAAQGNDVIYPRYEFGGSLNPFPDLDAGVAAARGRLGDPDVPEVVIGYSRGGRVAVDYAALEAAKGKEPAAVLAVFPGLNSAGEKLGPLDRLDSKTRIVMMVGDKDTGVGGVGARAILARLAQAGFPAERIRIIGVKSRGAFKATHLSALETGRGARSAFWKPADDLIDSTR
jgi:pimeloyl-ACP methyl ester carboxylesterase